MLMLHKYSYFRAAMKDIPPLASSFFGIADGGGGGGGSSKRYVSGASEYMKSMSRELETFRQKTLENLQAELEDCRSVNGGEGYANQALGQFAELKEKFDAYCDILGKRFNETEITYGRYRGTAEQLYLAAIDNL